MKRNHSRTFLFIIGAVATVVIAAGCHNDDLGSAGPQVPTVGVVQPVTLPVAEYAYFTGQIQAVDTVDIRARVTGYLEDVCYQPGTVVKKDTVLFKIDPSPYRAQVELAKGKLAEANAQVVQAKAKVVKTESQVAVDRVRLDIDKEVAKTSGAISKLKLEEDEAKVKESEAALAESKASVIALEASVKAAEANLAANQLNLDWTDVRSPIDGRADRNLLTKGNLVTADATTLTNIVAIGPVYVYFDVDELSCLQIQKEIVEKKVKPKEVPIDVALQDEEGFPHHGTVDLVANKLNESTGTLKVRGLMQNEQQMLSPGNFVRVRVAVDKPRDRLLVPDRAVMPEQGESFLLIVGDDNKVKKVRVEVGPLDPTDKTLRIVDSGLKAGQWVVVEGRQRIRQPGMTVKPDRLPQPGKPSTPPAKASPTSEKPSASPSKS
jgi:RND family efflux transporter MFP subunit